MFVEIESVSNHSTVTVNSFSTVVFKVSFTEIPVTVYLISVGAALLASSTPVISFK